MPKCSFLGIQLQIKRYFAQISLLPYICSLCSPPSSSLPTPQSTPSSSPVCLSAWLILHVSETLHCIENNFSGIFKLQRIRRRRDEIFIVSPAPRDRMRCAKFLGEIATFSFSPCQLLPWIVLTISQYFQFLYWNVNSIGIIFGPRLPRTIWKPPPSLIRKSCYIIVEPSSYLQNDAACIDSVR